MVLLIGVVSSTAHIIADEFREALFWYVGQTKGARHSVNYYDDSYNWCCCCSLLLLLFAVTRTLIASIQSKEKRKKEEKNQKKEKAILFGQNALQDTQFECGKLPKA